MINLLLKFIKESNFIIRKVYTFVDSGLCETIEDIKKISKPKYHFRSEKKENKWFDNLVSLTETEFKMLEPFIKEVETVILPKNETEAILVISYCFR